MIEFANPLTENDTPETELCKVDIDEDIEDEKPETVVCSDDILVVNVVILFTFCVAFV
jgi:hypothetical protein